MVLVTPSTSLSQGVLVFFGIVLRGAPIDLVITKIQLLEKQFDACVGESHMIELQPKYLDLFFQESTHLWSKSWPVGGECLKLIADS